MPPFCDDSAPLQIVSGMMDPSAAEAAENMAVGPGGSCSAGGSQHPGPLHSVHVEDEPRSTEVASRLRQERQEELAMLCTVLDRSNPWRVASLRRPQKRLLEQASQDLNGGKRRRRVRAGRRSVKMGPVLDSQSDSSGSESVELSLEGRDGSLEGGDGSLDLSDNRYVSSLEVHLRRSCVFWSNGRDWTKMGPSSSWKRKYHFEEQDSRFCDKSPKMDVAKSAKKLTLPSEDVGSVKDPLDRKASSSLQEDMRRQGEGDIDCPIFAKEAMVLGKIPVSVSNEDFLFLTASLAPEAAESKSPAGVMADGSQVMLNSSQLIDKIFEGVLDGSAEDLEMPDVELPPVSILSPLTKSLDLQAAFSPLTSVVSSLPELLEGTPETSAGEDHLPYSIDTYRTLRRNVQEAPASQKHAPKRQRVDRAPVDVKEKIKLLSKEVSSVQRIVEQSCCALSYCVDAEHGKGTRQEAEAERLLLLSSEKKAALLKELERLRDGSSEEPPSSLGRELTPCCGSVTISDIRLPLKVDYVCSTILETGPAGHYFLLLIRYGAHEVVATPLASTSDAHTGDTITFPTSITLDDTSADFRIEIEVYSLAQCGSALDKRKSLMKPKITPKKLLSSRKSSLNSPAFSPAVNAPLRSSTFLMVGSLTLTLDSLSKFQFPLEKMKLEGKVGRLLGDHFQDQVPFLSPLEGSLYLKLRCQSHSNIQRRGFLTMFEDVGGLAAWHRRWCTLSGTSLSFWAYPDQESSKEPLGRINLVNCTSIKVEAAKRESCARSHTLELITMRPQREDDVDTLVTKCRNMLCFTKSWLSADTREDGRLWMDALNQVLLDIRTWKSSPGNLSTSCQEPPPPCAQPCAR
ncbi:LOW QUALITY PROTEIN: anillin-like [Anomaloglossus baeobatrachus]